MRRTLDSEERDDRIASVRLRPRGAIPPFREQTRHDTHRGTRVVNVRDPHGRLWTLQAPATPVDNAS